jgi:hypothetical protein
LHVPAPGMEAQVPLAPQIPVQHCAPLLQADPVSTHFGPEQVPPTHCTPPQHSAESVHPCPSAWQSAWQVPLSQMPLQQDSPPAEQLCPLTKHWPPSASVRMEPSLPPVVPASPGGEGGVPPQLQPAKPRPSAATAVKTTNEESRMDRSRGKVIHVNERATAAPARLCGGSSRTAWAVSPQLPPAGPPRTPTCPRSGGVRRTRDASLCANGPHAPSALGCAN